MEENIQFLDVISMLNEDVQKRLKNETTDKYPGSGVIVNNVALSNFTKSLDSGCLFFRRFDNYAEEDEIRYENYNPTYCEGVSKRQADLLTGRNRQFGKSAYILSMYNPQRKGEESSILHMEVYTKTKEMDSVGLAVVYDMQKLVENIRKNAWRAGEKDKYDKTSIITLAEHDRIFMGEVCYCEGEDDRLNGIFDPSNAVAPLFLKRMQNRNDREYRICLIKSSKLHNSDIYTEEMDSEEQIYIKAGEIFSAVKSIFFRKEKGKDNEKIVEKELRKRMENCGYEWNCQEVDGGLMEIRFPQINAEEDFMPEVQPARLKEKIYYATQKKPRTFTLFSEKYDSMKQRNLLLRGNRICRYRCYQTSLRYDILLAGKVILTDSQFFDGMFFKKMIEYGQFEAFIHCVQRHDALEIRRRETEEKFIKKMYGQGFRYSSIQSYRLTKEIENIGKTIRDEAIESDICNTIDSYWDYIGNNLFYDKSNQRKQYFDEINQMKESFSQFFNVPEHMFQMWGEWREEYFGKSLAEEKAFEIAIEIAERLKEFSEVYDKKVFPLIKYKADNIIRRCKKASIQFKAGVPVRSEVMKNIDEIMDSLEEAENFEYLKELCGKIIAAFNYSYYKTIGVQHGAAFFESVSKRSPQILGNHAMESCVFTFDRESLDYISNCSWEEFEALLCDKKVEEAREQLYELLENISYKKERTIRIEVMKMMRVFEKLNDALTDFCKNRFGCSKKEGSQSFININAKSTGYFETEDLASQGGCRRFVGFGGAYEDNIANNLCIFIPNCDVGPRMFRLAFGEQPDEKTETVISPIGYE